MCIGGLGAGPQVGSARAVLTLTNHAWSARAALVGSLGARSIGQRAARRATIYSPAGGDTIPHIRISITASEAPVIAAALDEYRRTHDLHRLYAIRLQQLADGIRDARARLDAQDTARRCS